MYDSSYEKFADKVLIKVEGGAEPSLGDGKTYKRSPWWQSPEGNFHGDERYIMDVYFGWVWDGTTYIELVADGMRTEFKDLPSNVRRHFEIWQVVRKDGLSRNADGLVVDTRAYDYYYYDTVSQSWVEIEWFHPIYGKENLPRPGLKIGAAHLVIEQDWKVFWDGFVWRRPSHKNLSDDQPERHLPEGFIEAYTNQLSNTTGAIQSLATSTNEQFQAVAQSLDLSVDEFRSRVSDARMDFVSKTHLGLFPSIRGNIGALFVNGDLLLTDNVADVCNTDPVLLYTNGTITTDSVEPLTEYYVYCGNSDFDNSPTKLFLSKSLDSNGHLGDELPGLNARIVGKVETDNVGYFIREIDMSFIGKKTEFSETYWEYSDFQLQFVDQDTLSFSRIDGTHGLCYVDGQLLYLNTGKTLSRQSSRIDWNGGTLQLDSSAISPNTLYQIYIVNDAYEYNFNALGDDDFPLDEGDEGYDEALDYRRKLFLSTKLHDHRLFDEQYPGYYARHIGHIQTDSNGYFKYAADISLIRQPTLNPTSLDGLAECVIQDISTFEFKVTRKKGTTGVVFVGGRPVQTYDADNPLAHSIKTSDILYTYTEANISAPLSNSGFNVENKCGYPIYLYLANDIAAWGGIRIFCSLLPPTGGYLSTNWPGNNARWLATLGLAPNGLGVEKIVNGTFVSNASSWVFGDDWSYSPDNKNIQHTQGSATSLSQPCNLESDKLYSVSFSVSDRTAGTLTPEVHTTRGSTITTNTSTTQYLISSGNGSINFWPDATFNGAVDNVSVKEVVTGHFSGTYVVDSVSGVSAQINDAIVSNATTYSSNKIEQIRQQLLTKINISLGFNSALATGYSLMLEYVDSDTIRLYSLSGEVEVIFPNLDIVTVTTAGISASVSGAVNTLYYVYLSSVGELEIMTGEPTDVYAGVSYKGDSYMLVGYLSFTTTNNMSGIWNIYSFWNEPTRTFIFDNIGNTGRIYTRDDFWNPPYVRDSIGSGTVTVDLRGLLIPPNKTASTREYDVAMSTGQYYRMDGGGGIGWSNASFSGFEVTTTTLDSRGNLVGVAYCYNQTVYSFTKNIANILTSGIYNNLGAYAYSAYMSQWSWNGYANYWPGTERYAVIEGGLIDYVQFAFRPILIWDVNNIGKTEIIRQGNI